MTEAEWLACVDPMPMLEFLRGKASDRKLRLFACASCRRIWHLFLHDDSFRSIEVGERYADGKATDEELRLADELAVWAGDDSSWTSMQVAAYAWAAAAPVEKNGISAAKSAVYEIQTVFAENGPKCEEERLAQCHLLCEIFGNPFRPLTIDRVWRSPRVLALASAAYDQRLPNDQLAVLSDALEEASCADAGLLGHLRSGGEHWRGCYVVDAVLGKA